MLRVLVYRPNNRIIQKETSRTEGERKVAERRRSYNHYYVPLFPSASPMQYRNYRDVGVRGQGQFLFTFFVQNINLHFLIFFNNENNSL